MAAEMKYDYSGNTWQYDEETGEIFNKNTGERISVGGNFVDNSGQWGDGLRSNNLFRRGTQQDVMNAYAYWRKTGEMPTADELGIPEGALKNIEHDVKFLADREGLDFMSYQPPVDAETAKAKEDGLLSPYYFDINKMKDRGTKENDIYDTYLSLATKENEAATQKASQDEANMQNDLAGNRMKLLDELRNRRRTLLKNGLSSAQIANEEIQSVLIGQNQAQQIAGNYYMQRQDLNARKGMLGEQSYFNAAGLFDQMNVQGSAYAAGGAGDANYQAKLYDDYIAGGGNPETYNKVTNQ